MSWSKPFNEDELLFIQESFPRLSSAEIAKRLGRSKRGVNEQIRKLGLRDKEPGATHAREAPAAGQDEQPDPGSTLEGLLELKEVLRAAISDCGYKELPKMAAEYRATLEAIEQLGGNQGRQDKDEDDLSKLLGVIQIRGS